MSMKDPERKKIYLQLARHNEAGAGPVQLGQIADICGADLALVEQIRVLKVASIPDKAYGKYTLSAGEIGARILAKEPACDLCFLGDTDIVLEYKKPQKKPGIRAGMWSLFVATVVFVGSAFTFMTFIHEANLNGLFSRIYLYMGMQGAADSKGIEICFSLGVGTGMLLYFNHFGSFRLQDEPTPMEMEMKQYMQEAEETILEQEDRESDI